MRFNKIIGNTLLGLTLVNARVVMIIRHGEKIDDTHTDLSPIGQARADCLVETFGENGVFVPPQKIYAQGIKAKKSTRPRDTVTPLAKSLGLEVDLTYEEDETDKLIETIEKSMDEITLISWSNDNIKKMAKKFGVKDVPSYGSNVFNEMWIVTDGITPYFKENLNSTIIRTHKKGKQGYQLDVVDENVAKCMVQKQPDYNPPDLTGDAPSKMKSSLVFTLASFLGLAYLFL